MRRKRQHTFRIMLMGIFLLSVVGLLMAGFFYRKNKEIFVPPIPPRVSTAEGAGRRAPGLTLQSSNALLFDPATGEVLYAKGAEERIYPASLTKVMTAFTALDGIAQLDAPVTLLYEDYVGLYEQNASMAGFMMGETVTARDLLYAAMLPSGAEAAQALARVGSGSLEKAVEQMNQMALELGMKHTHFTNVTGMHDENHYTTVCDLALLWRVALQNPELLRAVETLNYTTTGTEQHPGGLLLVSTLVPRLRQLGRELAPIEGGKTGYTEEAGLCLVSVAGQDMVQRALVTVGAPGDGKSPPNNLIDAYNLYTRCLPKAERKAAA